MSRLGLAFRCFFRVLGGKAAPAEAFASMPDRPALPPDAQAREQARTLQLTLRLLALLQREGRFIDFLKEDLEGYDDEQVGAAARKVHDDCRRALDEHLRIEPVLPGEEDNPVTVEAGFDPSHIRLFGNVTGDPPFSGVLRHHGWRADPVDLPQPATEGDAAIVAPAEVELP